MKNERLLAIVLKLLDGKPCTAAGLAKEHGVTLRTIYRDMESLTLSGIPVLAEAGPGGGYALDRGYHLDKSFLTAPELSSVRSILEGVGRLSPDSKIADIARKFRAMGHGCVDVSFFRYDLDPWHQGPVLEEMVEQLQAGFSQRKLVRIEYCDSLGQSTERLVEPWELLITPKGTYIHAYCQLRADFRLFKLTRIRQCTLTDLSFAVGRRDFPDTWEKVWGREELADVVIEVASNLVGAVLDSFPHGELRDCGDKRWRLHFHWPVGHYLAGMLLALGEVRVIEPASLRVECLKIANSFLANNC